MKNVRIKSQGRFCCVGNKRYDYYNVVADSERFGANAIMCQGTFSDCLKYLNNNGIDYLAECIKQNRGRDIQVSFRMYRVKEETDEGLRLISRDGFERFLKFSDMAPTAPNTFRIQKDLFGKNAATVKLMDARAW